MAAIADTDEKSIATDNEKFVLPKISSFATKDIESLDVDSQLLINHKCKFTVGKNGNTVTFYPSPHLYDENGNFESGKSLESDSVDNACVKMVGTMGCDKLEASFSDHCDNDEIKNSKVLKQPGWTYQNSFINACELAWSQHYPIKLDASHIWLIILQNVALHVDQNSETLRKKWVDFDGKKELIVRNDSFVKGNRENNDWSIVISSFCEQIDKNTVGGTVDLLENDFSNSNEIDKIATKVTIMDICKNYFNYTCKTFCGFPQITLTGTKDDWIKLYQKTEKVLNSKVDPEFGKQWSDSLLPILARFIMGFDGEIDCLFWNSMIKRGARHGSGGWSWYSGWINIFFPLVKGKHNTFCEKYEATRDYITSGLKRAGQGNDVHMYPNGLGSAPVKWKYYSLEFKLKFIAGFVGVTQDSKTNELSPMIGWAIGEITKENEQTMEDIKSLVTKNKNIIGAK